MVDLAHLGGEPSLLDGLEEAEMPASNFVSFVQEGHPAIADWGPEAWHRFSHVQVAIGNEVRSPVDSAGSNVSGARKIGALISKFAAVRPLLAGSDMIATLPTMIMAWDMRDYGLRPMPSLLPVPPFRACFWS